jgi:4-alpha-glucanotransferase
MAEQTNGPGGPDRSRSLEWLTARGAGILLHPTSLHGDQGIGVLGPQAHDFVDFLADAGIGYWQMLPLGPTGYGDSPYQSFSAFAGNPYLIDLHPLIEYGILGEADLQVMRQLPRDHAHFASLYRIKWPLLRLAHKRFVEQQRAYLPNYGRFSEFCAANAVWLEPFCAFMALKERFNGVFWGDWPAACRDPATARRTRYWEETAQAREAHAFFQYLFFGQWAQLKAYAGERGVSIIGDAPIFVALDSSDVWASPQWFEMNVAGKPDFVAGVPPDYFSETGQLWGNPLYDWNAMEADGFSWWIDRLRANFRLFDVVRLDHFRGFWNYWRIPAGAGDARSGEWADGPREAFFAEVASQLPEARMIAEDLGDIDAEVRAFRDRVGLPGMAILQFAFDGKPDNLYLPHNLGAHSVLYPGTHDNNTTLGWYRAATPQQQDQVRRYFRVSGSEIAWDMIRQAYQSVSRLTVLQMQDLMALDERARMNIPGTEQGNWQWRMEAGAFEAVRHSTGYLRELAWLYGR